MDYTLEFKHDVTIIIISTFDISYAELRFSVQYSSLTPLN